MPLQEFPPSQISSGTPSSFTPGQVIFPAANGSLTSSASLFWDNTSLILKQTGSAAGNVAHQFRVTGDTQNRFQVTADGILGFGSGSAAIDATLYRQPANAGTLMLTGAGAGLQAAFVIDNATGTVKDLRFSTAQSLRWIWRSNSTAESGANAGSDLNLISFTDAGATLNGVVMVALRSSGFVGFNTVSPRVQVDSLNTSGAQFRATFTDNIVYTDFTTGAGGGLTIAPTGNVVTLVTSPGTSGLSMTITGGGVASACYALFNSRGRVGYDGSEATFSASMVLDDAGVNKAIVLRNTNNKVGLTISGSFVIGTGVLATTATDKFLYIPSCAGTPTGVPTTWAGTIPIVVDSTNLKPYWFVGGTWKKLQVGGVDAVLA